MNEPFPSLGEEVVFLRKENQRLAEKYNNLIKEFIKIDRISEFGADGLDITTHPVIGLQRWADKQYMVSFFPTDIKGKRFQYQSGIDKVYDLFLTEKQVEVIVKEYNKKKLMNSNLPPDENPKWYQWLIFGALLLAFWFAVFEFVSRVF